MALSEKTIAQIAKTLKLDKAKLETAIKSETEQDVEILELQVFTKTEIETRDRNNYDDGKTAGVDLWVKDKKTELGLDFAGKDPDKLIEAVKTKASEESGKAPDEKLKEKDTVIAGLRTNVTDLTNQINEFKQREETNGLENNILSVIPDHLPGGLTKRDALAIIKNNLDFVKQENGEYQVKRNGEIVRDSTTMSNLSLTDATKAFVKEKKWDVVDPNPKPRDGRGGGSTIVEPAGAKLSEVRKAWEAEGKSANTAEFSSHVQKLAKDNADFEFDE